MPNGKIRIQAHSLRPIADRSTRKRKKPEGRDIVTPDYCCDQLSGCYSYCGGALAGDYMDVTEPEALSQLLDLEGRANLRIFETSTGGSFHPKAYVFHHADGSGVAYVGSSNLSATALGNGVE